MSRYVPHGTYAGDELKPRSARPGAYDALQLPSRMGSRLITPTQLKQQENAARSGRTEAAVTQPPLDSAQANHDAAACDVEALPPATERPPLVEPAPPPKAMANFGQVASRHRRLQESETALAMWRAHVDSLRTRASFLSQIEQLRGHAPAIETPPFQNAA